MEAVCVPKILMTKTMRRLMLYMRKLTREWMTSAEREEN